MKAQVNFDALGGNGSVTYDGDMANPTSNSPYTITTKGHYCVIGLRGEKTLNLAVNGSTISPTTVSTNSINQGGTVWLMYYDLGDLNVNDAITWSNLAIVLKID